MGMDLERRAARPGMARPNMNVTPLVDVVLVLLIIFMVITPLLAKQFWLHLPDKADKERPPDPSEKEKPIVITVTKGGEIKINRDLVPKSDFATRLGRVLAARGERTVFFDAEDDAEFGNAVEVLDLARAGGAATIAVLASPIDSR